MGGEEEFNAEKEFVQDLLEYQYYTPDVTPIDSLYGFEYTKVRNGINFGNKLQLCRTTGAIRRAGLTTSREPNPEYPMKLIGTILMTRNS